MEVQPDMLEAADAPQGFTDYIVRFRKAGLLMRSQVCRVRTETEAMAWAHDAVQTGNWRGWAIMDVATVEESMARFWGAR